MEQNATVPLLRLCHGLRKLDFTPREDPKPGLIKIIALDQRGHLTQLKSLGFSPVGEVSSAVLLNFLGQVQDLFLPSKIDSDRSVQALAWHFATLEQVSISTDHNQSHKRLSLTLLESCPLLTVISGPRILAADIIESNSKWVCTKLRAFRVFVAVDRDVVVTQSRAIFERLSKLVHLHELTIRRPNISHHVDPEQGLDLTLVSGHDQLSPLTRLSYLCKARTCLQRTWTG